MAKPIYLIGSGADHQDEIEEAAEKAIENLMALIPRVSSNHLKRLGATIIEKSGGFTLCGCDKPAQP